MTTTIIGKILAPHGVRGLAKVQSYTSPLEAFFDYTPLLIDNQEITIIKKSHNGSGVFICEMDLPHREAVLPFKGKKIHTPKNALPDTNNDDTYHTDLIGQQVYDQDNALIGIVSSVQNFGASDILEIKKTDDTKAMVPYTRDAITESKDRIVIDTAYLI